MKYHIHVYNQIIECDSPKEVSDEIVRIYAKTGEHSVDKILELADMSYWFAKHSGCPGQDRLELNGLVITTE